MPTWIVSAERGSGKTTFLCAFAAEAAATGRSVGGVAAPAVIQNEWHAGYDLLNLRNNERRVLARLRQPGDCGTATGLYQFDDNALWAGQDMIVSAVRDRMDVIGIDEIGPLEFDGKGWFVAFTTALNEMRIAQHLIIVVRPSLVATLASRFPSPRWAFAEIVSPPWSGDHRAELA